jgi:hypothetical protein
MSQGLSRVAGLPTIARIPTSATTDTAANSQLRPCPMPNSAPSLRFVSSTKTPGTNSIRRPWPGIPSRAKIASFEARSAAKATPATTRKVVQPPVDRIGILPWMLGWPGGTRVGQRG